MKTVKEIKDFRDRNRRGSITELQQDFNSFSIDALIGITERLEATEQPPKVAWTGDVGSGRITSIGGQVVADIERAAMIKALRWADRWLTGDVGVVDGCPCGLCSAITRLENGGEL